MEIPNVKENWKNFFPELDIIPVQLKFDSSVKQPVDSEEKSRVLKQKRSVTASYKNPFDYSFLQNTKSKKKRNTARQLDMKSNKWTCMICLEVASDKDSLIEHYEKHRLEKEEKSTSHTVEVQSDYFVCPVCSKEFTSLKSYEKHVEMQHGEKRYTCEECNKGFNNAFQLSVHNYGVHTNDGMYNCVKCEFTTECRVSLKRHMQIHKEEYKFKCNICGKGFLSPTWYGSIFYISNLLMYHKIL